MLRVFRAIALLGFLGEAGPHAQGASFPTRRRGKARNAPLGPGSCSSASHDTPSLASLVCSRPGATGCRQVSVRTSGGQKRGRGWRSTWLVGACAGSGAWRTPGACRGTGPGALTAARASLQVPQLAPCATSCRCCPPCTRSRTLYDILEVPRSADEAQIKRAFKKLAMANHPDRNPGDAPAHRISTGPAAHKLHAPRPPSRQQLSGTYHRAPPCPSPAGDDTAAKRFSEINEAYEVLSDPEQRQIYDKYGEEGLKQRRAGGGGGGGGAGGMQVRCAAVTTVADG